MNDDGLLAGPLDVDAPRSRRPAYRHVEARRGLVVSDRGTGLTGAIVEFGPPRLVLRDPSGHDHVVRYDDGSVRVGGEPVALRAPRAPATRSLGRTPSGSLDPGPVPPRVARAGRIWVEGIHDAELVERVWGDDLRVEGVVVERLDGADHLVAAVRRFGPGPGRRLGILLDHLVEGSKEQHLAADIDHPDVLITGHPYVDVWQTVKPSVIGIDRWPDVAAGRPWKEGVLEQLGFNGGSADFWRHLLGRVESWSDLEAPLLGAVEQLIDFVAPPETA